MDIRQIVMVSALRDPIVSDLCNLFEFEVSFNDPGVGHFGPGECSYSNWK